LLSALLEVFFEASLVVDAPLLDAPLLEVESLEVESLEAVAAPSFEDDGSFFVA
jgi:hypothetical protein